MERGKPDGRTMLKLDYFQEKPGLLRRSISSIITLICFILLMLVIALFHNATKPTDAQRWASRTCNANMAEIVRAIQNYAHMKQRLPESLEVLHKAGFLQDKVLLCPAVGHVDLAGRSPLKLGRNVTYIYVGNGLNMEESISHGDSIPLLYEPVSNHGTYARVAFLDGHIEVWSVEKLEREMKNGRLAHPRQLLTEE